MLLKSCNYFREENMPPNKKKSPFISLSWNDLTEWAGSKIVSRGKSYQTYGRVKDISRFSDSDLIAWVEGTKRYVTRVRMENGNLSSSCTCPYGYRCKHAVAVILEYLDCLKKNVPVPQIAQYDSRFQIPEDSDTDEDEYPDAAESANAEQYDQWQSYLSKHNKNQLIKIISELARDYPEVRRNIQDRMNLYAGDISKIVAALKAEIDDITAEPAWSNHWSDECDIPDYSGVRSRIKVLLNQGYADEILVTGEYLLEAGSEQLRMSSDQGETGEELSSCMELVFQALPASSLSNAERMIWAADMILKDEFEVCDGAYRYLNLEHAPADWHIVADRLMARLGTEEFPDTFTREYRRDRLTNQIITALEGAGRQDEIIPLCRQEAAITHSYERLVNRLMAEEMWDEAEQWIQKGIKATAETYLGIASTLRKKLEAIREKQGDWLSITAFHTEDFLKMPSVSGFQKVREPAEKAGIWEEIREKILDYPKTGKIVKSGWPFPVTVPDISKYRYYPGFPMLEVLMDIAILEKRTDDLLKWYNDYRARKHQPYNTEKIAAAIADIYPDKAVEIWKERAERFISEVKTSAYEQAGICLSKVCNVLTRLGREDEWHQYLSELRRHHARKRNLIQILNKTDGKTILDGL